MVVLLQLPEGLKHKAPQIIQELGLEDVVISSSPMYGGCDIAIDEARAIGADRIVHVGHTYFPLRRKVIGIEVEYIPYYIDIKIGWEDLVQELKRLNINTISILTTTQHYHQYSQIVEYFETRGFQNRVRKGPFCSNSGQVLGCDAYGIDESAQAAVIIADGMFHWTAATHVADRMYVFGINPYTGKFSQVNDVLKKILKKRMASLFRAAEAKVFGILVSTKPGQFSYRLAKKMKDELISLGKDAYILVSNNLDPTVISNFMFIQAFINTACPRIVDDVEQYKKPIVNPEHFRDLVELIRKSSSMRLEPIQ
ncbi:MAG: diphthamide biosynthesis enzyme Dph2 [Candidatus Micrarchaeota archaeon]|nr:diphthamide biosynthesis enzyme Dph2 [Candidatus Micrarchaeota archaeon]MCX8154728.1 diphthamide biosynthesis enzyme Dph2 [Candidatus Micrarchaeota archaeon]